MSLAIVYGMSSGALHAVTGPDHLLSLGPSAIAQKQSAMRVGLQWGAGHAVGSWLLAIPLLLLQQFGLLSELEQYERFFDGIGALALMSLGAWSLWHHGATHSQSNGEHRSAFAVGTVHGVSGAASLVLFLPALMTGNLPHSLAFLLTFGIGSTLAMAALTHALGRASSHMSNWPMVAVQKMLSASSVIFGGVWLIKVAVG